MNWVVIRFRVEGWHNWPDAPEERIYLAQTHRHMFHVEVSIQVFDLDREIEYHEFKSECVGAFTGGYMGPRSCGMMANNLLTYIAHQHPNRHVKVGIFEDGENGSIVEYEGAGNDRNDQE